MCGGEVRGGGGASQSGEHRIRRGCDNEFQVNIYISVYCFIFTLNSAFNILIYDDSHIQSLIVSKHQQQ